MAEDEQAIVTKLMMKGFSDMAATAGTRVTGGQTIVNPAPIIGGVAMSVVSESEFIRPCSATEGDLVVLTKPIGTQVAVNLYEWFYVKRANYDKLINKPEESKVLEIFEKACKYMSTLNRTAASLMHKYHAKACTDVTGFGILGHASNLASVQHNPVNIRIHTLPIIAGVKDLDKQARNFKLLEGYSAETSGGLLIVLPAENAQAFLAEFFEIQKTEAWVIGEITPGNNQAVLEISSVIEV